MAETTSRNEIVARPEALRSSAKALAKASRYPRIGSKALRTIGGGRRCDLEPKSHSGALSEPLSVAEEHPSARCGDESFSFEGAQGARDDLSGGAEL